MSPWNRRRTAERARNKVHDNGISGKERKNIRESKNKYNANSSTRTTPGKRPSREQRSGTGTVLADATTQCCRRRTWVTTLVGGCASPHPSLRACRACGSGLPSGRRPGDLRAFVGGIPPGGSTLGRPGSRKNRYQYENIITTRAKQFNYETQDTHLLVVVKTLVVVRQPALALGLARRIVGRSVEDVARKNFLPERKAAGRAWKIAIDRYRMSVGDRKDSFMLHFSESKGRTAVQAVAGRHCGEEGGRKGENWKKNKSKQIARIERSERVSCCCF